MNEHELEELKWDLEQLDRVLKGFDSGGYDELEAIEEQLQDVVCALKSFIWELE